MFASFVQLDSGDRLRALVLMLALAAGPAVQADILHLRDGSRYYGTLISQNERAIVFRVTLDDGTSGAVRSFPMALVKRVERTARTRPPVPDHGSNHTPAAAPSEDFEQMLREAFELLDDEDLPGALRAMQRVAMRASREQLVELDRQTCGARDLPLARLVAETRFAVAVARGRGRTFRLGFVTPYEAPAMGLLLERLQGRLLARVHQGRTIAQWAAERDAYAELHPQAPELVADASLATALIGARLKSDPRLRGDREQRRRLTFLRDDVTRLAAHVRSMRGFTALSVDKDDPSNPAAREVARLRAVLDSQSESGEQPDNGGATSAPATQPAAEEEHP
jgi:hypothetical protein